IALVAMALLLLAAFRRGTDCTVASWLTVATLIAALVLVLVGNDGRELAFDGLFVADGFGAFLKVLVLGGAGLAILMSLDYLEREFITQPEFPILLLFSVLGMLMMISANDLISLYIGLELQSLALYVVAAFRRDALRSTEAGLKYF